MYPSRASIITAWTLVRCCRAYNLTASRSWSGTRAERVAVEVVRAAGGEATVAGTAHGSEAHSLEAALSDAATLPCFAVMSETLLWHECGSLFVNQGNVPPSLARWVRQRSRDYVLESRNRPDASQMLSMDLVRQDQMNLECNLPTIQ